MATAVEVVAPLTLAPVLTLASALVLAPALTLAPALAWGGRVLGIAPVAAAGGGCLVVDEVEGVV